AGTVIVSGKIDGDLLAAGEVIELTETAEIGGDLLLAGRRVIINGRVKGKSKIVGDDVTLNGALGSVTVWTDQLSVGARANLSGELSYHAPTVAKLDPLANLGGGVKYSQTSADKRPGRLANEYWWLTILGSILAILAMLKFLPRTANHLVGQYHKNWMLVLAIGLLSIIITPIIAVIFLFSGLGAPLGLILIALWLTLAVLAAVVGKLILGAWLIRLLGRQPTAQLDWRSAVAGVLALAILSFLPGVGALAWFVVWLSGLGSLVLLLKRVDTLGANE
ncbi:MAG: polymer-forming cytoskeletal protein, partial [Patescibacteria group bacterium]